MFHRNSKRKAQRDELKARRNEVTNYDNNIARYKTLLTTLPETWPKHLAALRDPADRQTAAAQLDDLQDVETYALLIFREELHARLRAETYERAKAKAVLEVLGAGR